MGVKITNLPTTPVKSADYIPVANTSDGTRKVLMEDVLSSGHGVPAGGSSGQVLVKASATDYDVAWADQSGGGGGGGDITVDSALSSTSINPVQNRVITAALGDKADSADVDALETELDAISETTVNYFTVDGGTYNGVTITVEDDGTLLLNGTSTAAAYILLENTLPAGTYTAKQTTVSGSQTGTGHPNLRYNSSSASSSSTRWVNGATTTDTQTFTGTTYMFLNFGSGQTFANFRVRYQVEAGSSVGNYVPGGLTAVDWVARSAGASGGAVTSVNGQTGAVVLTIPSTAADVGAIAAPSSPTSGQFLVYDGTAWVAQTLSTWAGGSY